MMISAKFHFILHFAMKQKFVSLAIILLICHLAFVRNEGTVNRAPFLSFNAGQCPKNPLGYCLSVKKRQECVQHVATKLCAYIPCEPRYFDAESFVCVCNATYCDTIEKPNVSSNSDILVYTTAKEKYRFDAKTLTFQDTTRIQELTQQDSITIDASARKQQIIGFGGSFTDASGINIKKLSNEAQQKLMESYFSEKGLEYNLGRVPIGGCDFSPRPYSYDDDSIGDFEFKNFSLQFEDYNYKIPLIKEARKLSPYEINLVATAWSPPAWMKTSDSISCGVLNGTVGGKYYKSWANYYIKFFEEYEKNGVLFWAVTNGNEPAICFTPNISIDCLGFTPDSLRVFFNEDLAPKLRASRYNGIKLLIHDFERSTLIPYVTEVMNDTHAEEYVDGIALHWYNDSVVSPDVQDFIHNLYENKFLLTTEACITTIFYPGPPVLLGSWSRANSYAYYIIQNLQHWDSGWIDWNLVLDLQGGPNWANNFVDAPVIVNETSDEFYKQPMFYVMGHFSKFVPPGSVLINSYQTGALTASNISTVAFLIPDSMTVVLVVLNSNESDVSVNIIDGNDRTFQTTVPGNSLQTYIWRKD